MEISLKKILSILIFTSFIIGLFLRIFNLNWGAPFYFHPDERNIASAISQLRFPEQLNPHFFAYGSFPIYTIYFLGVLWNSIQSLITNNQSPITVVSFEQAILASRIFSALLSTLLIPLLYVLGTKIKNKQTGLFASFLATLSVGFIQYAHFGTFEMWLTFFGTLLFYFCLSFIKDGKTKNLVLMGIVSGLLVAIKVSSLVLLAIPLLIIAFKIFSQTKAKHFCVKYGCILVFTKQALIITVVSFIIFAITSPFVFLDFSSFRGSMDYESGVAFGTLPVFYTGDFFDTTPILYQFTHIYPFLLNPFVALLFIPALFYITYLGLKQKNSFYFLLLTIYYLLFLSQAFLFAKWSRYIVPTLPFVYLIIGVAFFELTIFLKKILSLRLPLARLRSRMTTTKILLAICLIVVNTVFSLSYFLAVQIKPDTRIAAALWAKDHIPPNAAILSEVYDLGILPFNQLSSRITLFNFYDLDELSNKKNELYFRLSQYDYIILPSPRIVKSRLTKPQRFPKGNAFYQALFDEKLGFEKVYETPCGLSCAILYMGDPVFRFEQTVNIFDRPTVYIFKRIMNDESGIMENNKNP